jgi:flavin reductase (DIM6/NTAB) family NADH-FMN oxidoreductase RutF
MTEIPEHRIYRYFEPRPIILINTFDGEIYNTMTASLYNTLDEQPCTLAINMGAWDRTLEIIKDNAEVVISIPTADILPEMGLTKNDTTATLSAHENKILAVFGICNSFHLSLEVTQPK